MKALIVALGCIACAGQAQEGRLPEIEVVPAIERLLDAPHLGEDEKRAIRLRHGLIDVSELTNPTERARLALQRGVLDDDALRDPRVPGLLRARVLVLRGELEEALALLDDDDSIEGLSLRARALALLGRFEEADRVLDQLVERLARERIEDADRLAEGVRGLMLRERLGGTRRRASDDDRARRGVRADYQTMTMLLGRARDELDRLSWRARLVESELLFDKDNRGEAIQAAVEALSLNPGLSEAWFLLGNHFVDSFDFDRALLAASRLDELAHSLGSTAPSWRGELIRARERLRQNDPVQAAQILDELLARYPKLRPAIALRAACAVASFDEDEARRWLDRYEELSPGAPEALFAVGVQLSEDRQYEEAARYLRRAHERLRTWAKPVIELGLLEVQSGRDGAARDALLIATRLDPFNVRAENSLKLIDELLTYETIESEHFVVRYKDGIDAVLAREMPPVLERIHARVAGPSGIDHEPARKTVIELMPDHRWFSVRITGMKGVHTMAAATGPVIALEAPREGPNHLVGEYDWARVLQHEYTHTVTLSRTRNRIPHWFTEAAAVYLEDAPRNWDWCVLLSEKFRAGELFDLEEINVRFVRPIEPTDRTLAYAQGHWMYEFIMARFGARAPLELMDRYASGVGEGEAMRSVLGISPERFMEEFLAYAREDLCRWGLLPPEGYPSIHELRSAFLARDDASEEEVPAEELHRWLDAYPDHPDVLAALCAPLLDGHAEALDDDGVALLEALARARPVDPAPRRRLVRHFLDAGQDERAIEHLEWLDAREEHSPAYSVRLARIHAKRKDYDRAHAASERATTIAPYDAHLRELGAQMALLAGRHDDARRHIEALVLLEPDREIHKKRLEALRRRGG